MPFLAALVYWWRVPRRDIHPTLKRRLTGGAAIWTLSAVLIEIWVCVVRSGLRQIDRSRLFAVRY